MSNANNLGSVPDFLGSTAYFSSITNAEAGAFQNLFVPEAGASTGILPAALTKNYWGPGQLTMGDGNQHGKNYATFSSYPSYTPNNIYVVGGVFDGTWTHVPEAVEITLTSGCGAMGANGSSGFVFNPQCSAVAAYVNAGNIGYADASYNQSGSSVFTSVAHNSSTSGHDLFNYYGQLSLLGGYNTGGAASTWGGGSLFTGQVGAAANYVYATSVETLMADNSYITGMTSFVGRLKRTNSYSSNSNYWAGTRIQAEGSALVDYAFQAFATAGGFTYGLDLTLANCTYGIALPHDRAIFFNATGTSPQGATSAGTTSIGFNSSTGFLETYVGGNLITQHGSGGVLNVASATAAIYTHGVQVVGQRVTGRTNASGGSTAGLVAGTATLAQTAAALADVINILFGHGLMGT